MKKLLQLQVLFLLMCSVFTANAQTETLKVSDSITLNTGQGFVTNVNNGSGLTSAGITYNGKLYSFYEDQPFTRKLVISNNTTVKRINPPAGYIFTCLMDGFGGNMYVALSIGTSSHLAKIDANDNITIIPTPVALGTVRIISSDITTKAFVFQNKLHFMGLPGTALEFNHYSYDGTNFQLYAAPTGLAAIGTFFAYQDTVFSRYKTISSPVSIYVCKTIGTSDVKIDNPVEVLPTTGDGAGYFTNGEAMQGINSKGLYCPVSYIGPGFTRYFGIMKYANGQMTKLPNIPNQSPNNNFHGFITYKDSIFFGVLDNGTTSWGSMYKIEADTLKLVSNTGNYMYPIIYNDKLQYGTEFSINPPGVGTKYYTYHDGIIDTILPPGGQYIKLDNLQNKAVFKNNFYYNTVRSGNSTAKFALIKYNGINSSEVSDPLQATLTTDGRGPSGKLTVNADALIVQYEAMQLSMSPDMMTIIPAKFYYSQVYKSCIPVTAIVTPSNKTLCAGINDTTTVSYSGTADSFEWYKDGVLLAGQTTEKLVIANASSINAGTYYLKIISSCKIDSTGTFTITINNAPLAPTAIAQTVCAGTSLSNLTPAPSASVRWYSAASGGSALAGTTTVNTSTTYYIDSVNVNGCVSITRTSVDITASIIPSPTTSSQSLCSGATVADLIASGTAIKWYATATGGTPLANTLNLVNGTKYYATQTLGTCESAIRAADSVTIVGSVTATSDTIFCNNSTAAINFIGAAGNTYNWTATQNGSGIAASGTGNISFTASNNSNTIVKDTVMVAAGYTSPYSYTITDGTYAFADTSGAAYLNLSAEYSTGNLSSAKPIGFNFNFFGTNFSNIYISNLGSITFDAGATKLIYGQLRGSWTTDANSKIAYKTTGTAPNRKLVVSFIDLKKPADITTIMPFGPPINTSYTADPPAGRGTFQIVLNETANTIESLKQSVPALTAFTTPIGFGPSGNVGGNYEGVKSGTNQFYVGGRENGDWLKLISESKIFTPVAGFNCTGNKDTFLISVNPLPKVDSIPNQQACPGGVVAAINFSTAITGVAVGYKWINNNTATGLAASGTGNIASFTANSTTATSTITVTPFILKAATDTCFGTAKTFTLTIDLPAPPSTTSLVIYTGTKNLSQLNIPGTNVQFYANVSGGTALPGTTLVIDDSTYYVTQTLNGCESNRKKFTVNRIANDSIVLCAPATVAGLTATPQTGNTAQWFDVPTGGAALASTAALQPGQDTLYVEEGSTKTDTLVRRSGSFVDFIDALGHDENDSLYFATWGSNKVYSASPDGSVVTPLFATNGTPRSVYYKKEGANRFLYYLEDGSAGVRKRNLVTGVTTTIGSGLFWASQMAFDDANGIIYVADRENSKLKKIVVATNAVSVIDSFITTPPTDYNRIFGVAYNAATNTIFFNNFDKGKVYSKNLTGANAKVEILAIQQPWSMSLLPNGKLLIACGTGRIYTCNQDGTSPVIIKDGLYSTNDPFYNNNGELTYNHLNTINKETNNQSNRVPVTVIVNPVPNFTPVADAIVCNGASVPAINFASTTTGGTVTYSWTNNNTTIGLAASGSGDIAGFTAVNNGTAPVTATVIVTPTITNAGVSCAGVKDTFLITVNPTATVNPVTNQVICNGSSTTAVTFSSPATGGTVVYNWTNNTPSIGLAASGVGNIASFTAVNNGAAPVVATITVTPSYTNGGVTCTGTPATFTYTVNPTAAVNAVTSQVICNGAPATAVAFSSPTTGGSIVYNWTNDKPSIGLAANGAGNIASFNAVNNGTAPVTATIVVTPSYTNAGVTCTGTVQTFTITVNPTATVNAMTNQVICNGTPTTAVTFSSPTTGGTIIYNWTNNTASIGLAASGTGNIASFNAVNNGTAPVTATITVTPLYTNAGVTCVGTAQTYTYTVNPTATLNAITSQVICNGSSTSAVNFSSPTTGGSIVYNWTNSTASIGLAASGTGNIAAFNAVNNGTAPVTATITATPSYTNAGVTCVGMAQTYTYTVNPTATVNAVANQVLCNNSPTTVVAFSSPTTGGTIVYNWTNNAPSIGLAATGTGNIGSFNAVNNGTAPVTATITVTPSYTNAGVTCTGVPQIFTVTVNPTAVVNTVSNQTVCADVTNNIVSFSSPVAGTFYNWTNSNPSIGLAASGTGTVPSFTAVNPLPNATSCTITVTPNTAAGCIGQPITYTITVNGKSVAPVSVNNPTPIVCANNAFATLTVNGGALGSGATWKWYADSLNTVSIGSGPVLSNIAVAKTTTYFVRAEGTCNNTAAASIVVQRANLVHQVRQHWSDVLLFDNSSNNYVAWQWYKNAVAVAGATMQQYSENTALTGTYYVVATDKNGAQTISCPLNITAGSFTGLRISLFPNPADKGANVTVSTNFTTNELQGASIIITDVFGRVIQQTLLVTPNTAIQAPAATGMYIVTLTLQNGMKYSANLLTK